MSVTKSLSDLGSPIAYYPSIARFLGGDVGAAVFLCQFIYWRGKVGDRQIYKSRAEIEQETGLSDHIQKRICSMLKAREYVKIVKKGMPARNFYQFDWAKIDKDWEAQLGRNRPTSEAETARLVRPDGTDLLGRNRPTTSETTAETTAETTSESTRTGSRATTKHPTLGVPINETRYQSLVAEWGRQQVDDYIQRAIDYIAANRPQKPYKDYAAAAAQYIRGDVERGKLTKPSCLVLPDIDFSGTMAGVTHV